VTHSIFVILKLIALFIFSVPNNCPVAVDVGGVDPSKLLQLAIASASIIGISSGFRLFMALQQVWRGRKDLHDWADWLYVWVGVFVTIIDPWNGALVRRARNEQWIIITNIGFFTFK